MHAVREQEDDVFGLRAQRLAVRDVREELVEEVVEADAGDDDDARGVVVVRDLLERLGDDVREEVARERADRERDAHLHDEVEPAAPLQLQHLDQEVDGHGRRGDEQDRRVRLEVERARAELRLEHMREWLFYHRL